MKRPLFFSLLVVLLVLLGLVQAAQAEQRPPVPGATLVPPDTPTPTPTETATPTPTSTPAPRGPVLESLLDDSWWLPSTNPISVTVAAAWQAVCAGSLADSYDDLTGNGHDITTGVDPAWSTTTGWTFNGSKYLITNITHDAANLHSILVDMTNAGTASSYNAIGLQTTNTLLRIYPYFYGTFYYSYWSSSQPSSNAGAGVATGVIGITTDAIYVDGVIRKSISVAGPASGQYIQIGADGTAERFIGTIRSVAIYAGGISATQVAEISANMAALPAGCAPTATPTATATATNTPTATATPTNTPTATNTPSPTPAPLTNYIELPSGGVAALAYSVNAGEAIIAALAAAVAVLLLYELLRQLAHERAK